MKNDEISPGRKKMIYVADAFVILASAFVLIWLVGYAQPLVIAPIDNYSTSEPVLFSFEKADVILIDDNLEFSSPMKIYAENNLVVNLEPGKYYWKVEGALPSDVRMLTIETNVDLRLKESNGNYEVLNAGNMELDVRVYSNYSEIDRFVLNADESKDFSGNKVVGGQNG